MLLSPVVCLGLFSDPIPNLWDLIPIRLDKAINPLVVSLSNQADL
jgi:hypothetical protein